MTGKAIVAAALLAGTLGGCVAPVGPVEVTRFHLPGPAPLGQGPIAVEPAPGMAGDSPEMRSYAAAVGRELARIGYSEVPAGSAGGQIALVRLERRSVAPEAGRNPVSVGVGGGTGSFGSGVGVGIGINLSGPPPAQVETLLAVSIRERASGRVLWEGRARFAVSAKSPLADTQLGAARQAQALFRDFPGTSGETILVP